MLDHISQCLLNNPVGRNVQAGWQSALGPSHRKLGLEPGSADPVDQRGHLVQAGLDAELSISGTQRPLPPGLDLAAYRIVQEALTNVIKHAGPAHTDVHVEYRPRELRITVADDGRPADADPARGQSPGHGGRGLIGLRERIAIYRGELDAGPRPGGGWQVRARIPLEPVADGQGEARAEFQAASP